MTKTFFILAVIISLSGCGEEVAENTLRGRYRIMNRNVRMGIQDIVKCLLIFMSRELQVFRRI